MDLSNDLQTVGLLKPDDSLPLATDGALRLNCDRRPRRHSSRLALLDVLCWTCALALMAGLIESAYWSVRAFGLGEIYSYFSPHVFWMSPVAKLAIFSVPGLILVIVAGRTSEETALAHTVFWLSGLFYVDLLCLAPPLGTFPHLLLACGLAAVTAKWAVRRPRLFRRSARLLACCLPWVVLAVAVGQLGGRWHREHHAVASLPPAPKSAPNVLFIVLDTVRSDPFDSDLAPFESLPSFRRLAESATTFASAQAPSPWTLPSHASMFTGLLPSRLSADWGQPLDQRFDTLAEALASVGYLTAGFVANTHYCSRWTGLDQGFAHYEDYGFTCLDFVMSTALGRRVYRSDWPAQLGHYDDHARKPGAQINADFLDWLSGCKRRPWFVFLNYFDAHHPYLPSAPFDEHVPRTLHEGLGFREWWWIDKQALPPERVEMARKAYSDCLRYLDWQLGELLDELERRGELNDTLLVVVSDHGEHFGEHGLFLHGNSLYQPLLHVPLAIRWPGRVAEGRRITVPVSTRDLAATILDLAGLPDDISLPGRSLAWLMKPGPQAPTAAPWPVVSEVVASCPEPPDQGRSPVAGGAMRSVLLGTMKYVRNGDGTEELYDVRNDPRETLDLATDVRYRVILRRCRRILDETGPDR